MELETFKLDQTTRVRNVDDSMFEDQVTVLWIQIQQDPYHLFNLRHLESIKNDIMS